MFWSVSLRYNTGTVFHYSYTVGLNGSDFVLGYLELIILTFFSRDRYFHSMYQVTEFNTFNVSSFLSIRVYDLKRVMG